MQLPTIEKYSPRASTAVLFLVGFFLLFVAPVHAQTSPSSGGAGYDYGMPQIATINKYIRAGWTGNELRPSPPATDGEWCRRVYLDLIGRVPSVEEMRKFVKETAPDKKRDLVDQLLGDRYADEYARNWTTIWTNVLIGRTGGTGNNTMISRPGMQQYLRRCFQRNKSYDSMVHDLVTATGTSAPGEDNFNGATNFLVDKFEEKGAQATAKTAQIFLGLQVQCTQCHNHPFNDWKQNQFWELNAFFRQTRPLQMFGGRNGRMTVAGNLVDEGFRGEGANADPADAALFYELRNGILKSAYPVFVDGTSLIDIKGKDVGNSGYLEDVNRRQELAKLILKSEYLDKAIVNRIWSRFLGYGFTKPIDDMGPHNPPTHPELLEYLGKEVRRQSFNLKELMRWITLSEAYSLSSRMIEENKRDDPTLGEKPMFSHFYLRQMQAEELYESLIVATEAHKTERSYERQEQAKQRWMSQFVQAFGTDENDEATTFNGTIPQALMLMNGDLVKKATSSSKGSFLHNIYSDKNLSGPQKITYLYEAALAREPTSKEVTVANKMLQMHKGDVLLAMQDVWWVLLNSNEFILNH